MMMMMTMTMMMMHGDVEFLENYIVFADGDDHVDVDGCEIWTLLSLFMDRM